MQVAILGGTGDIGEGLALRFSRDTNHSVIVGSRKQEKALNKATEYRDRLEAYNDSSDIVGMDNKSASEKADIVVLGIPPQYIRSTVESLDSVLTEEKVIISPAVGMQRDKAGFHYDPPSEGSIAELIRTIVPNEVPVIGAFQNLAAGALSNLEAELDADVIVTGDNQVAKDEIIELTKNIDGLRALDGGPLSNSAEVESITPLLINLAMNNEGMHDLGVRFQ